MPPSTPQSEIPKSSKQTKIIKLNHFTSLGFQQTLQNSLGVFHSFPLTLRLLVLQFLFTKLSTSTRTSCHLNIEGPPGWGFRIPTQLFNQHFLLFGISYKNSPTKKRNPDIRKKQNVESWIMNRNCLFFKNQICLLASWQSLSRRHFANGTSSGSMGKWIKWWKWDLPVCEGTAEGMLEVSRLISIFVDQMSPQREKKQNGGNLFQSIFFLWNRSTKNLFPSLSPC